MSIITPGGKYLGRIPDVEDSNDRMFLAAHPEARDVQPALCVSCKERPRKLPWTRCGRCHGKRARVWNMKGHRVRKRMMQARADG